MILGIGTDIIEIKRIEKALEKDSFLNRYFTSSEISLYHEKGDKAQSIAANFAAKEAVVKAMGTGFSSFSAIDIEILRNKKGTPIVNVYGKCKNICAELGIETFHLSLSHCKEYATAFVIAESSQIIQKKML